MNTMKKIAVTMLTASLSAGVFADIDRQYRMRDLEPTGPRLEQFIERAPLREIARADWQNVSKQRVAVSLPITDYMQSFEQAPAHRFESREYWQQVSGAELQSGITLKTTAPGAVVRVSGIDGLGKAKIIEPSSLKIGARGQSMKSLASASAKMMKAQGNDDPLLTPGALAFKLQTDIGYGELQLLAEKAMDRNATYLVHVFEPESPFTLNAGQQKTSVLAGSELNADAALQQSDQKLGVKKVLANSASAELSLLAPDGRRIPLNVQGKGGQWQINEAIDYPLSYAPGLWQLEWKVRGEVSGLSVERHIRTAFAYGAKSAEWQGNFGYRSKPRSNTLFIDVPVTVHQAGRFELRATASQDLDGQLFPVQLLSTAQWLEPGKRTITLQLDKAQLRRQGVRGAIRLEHVSLLDQTQMLGLQQHVVGQLISQRMTR